MFYRTRVSGFAKFVLAALLFTQAALAVAGCDFDKRSAARAVAAMGEARCPNHGDPGVLDGNANLCVVSCTSDAQNVDTSGLTVQAFPAVVVLTVSPAPGHGFPALRRAADTSYAFAAPPVRILIHNLRI